MSRVFILGAGFSKQADMPLATELTSLILGGRILRNDQEAQRWAADLKKRIAKLEGTGAADFAQNVEQLFDCAAFDEELCRMRQQLVRVARSNGQTPWIQADKIKGWRRLMEYELAGVIWDRQQGADLHCIRRFTDRLSGDDKVITFNYDTLVERALSEQKKPWNHGLNDQGNGGTTVLKMHGSIHWMLLERRKESELDIFVEPSSQEDLQVGEGVCGRRYVRSFVKLFSKEDLMVSEQGGEPPDEEEYRWELWGATDVLAGNPFMEEVYTCGWSNLERRLGLAGLGSYKPLHKLPGSAKTWDTAFQALNEAKEIYVIGFSMSPYDTMTRLHFSAVLHARQKPPLKTVVVDPNATALARDFHRVFGDTPELVPRQAQDIDWGQVLA